jgi:alanine racemase
LEACAALPGVRITGLMSHFANSGAPGDPYTEKQTRSYLELLAQVESRGFACIQGSLYNSGGILVPPADLPPSVNIMRSGITLYGGLPAKESAGLCNTKEAMSYSTRLAAVRRVKAGSMISYGMTYQTPVDTWLGVVPVGYSDGYLRALSNRGFMLVNGQRAPVRGRVCMNLTVLDLGGLDQLPQVDAPVVILGRQGAEYISAEDIADWAGTISYEIFTSLGIANKRRYIS